MAFLSITTTAGVYPQDTLGNYNLVGAAFNAPENHFRLTGGVRVKTDIRANVTRRKLVDVQVPGAAVGVIKRVPLILSLNITAPNVGFTPTEIAAMVSEIQQFCTAGNLDRLLKGEI